jgi:outer membrane protein OmpA-like peptidoglycan-associated protein
MQMSSSKAADKATRQLRQSGVPLARAAVHAGRRQRQSPILLALFGVGCLAMLGGGAAMALMSLEKGPVVVAVAPAAAAIPAVAAPVQTPAAAVVAEAPAVQTAFAARRETDLGRIAVSESEAATVLSNLRAVTTDSQAAAVVEPDCRSTLNAVAQAMHVTFGISSNALDPATTDALDRLATEAAQCDGVQIVVAGHSDTTGSPEANMALSWQRADEVVAAIVGLGHDPQLFNAVGYGARNPVLTNGTVDEAASRRVEFLVTMADATLVPEVTQ